MNSCRANLDLVTLYGVPVEKLANFFPALDIDAATMAQFQARADGALVGARLAQRRGVGVGGEIGTGQVTASVLAVYETGEPFLDNLAIMHLDEMLLTVPDGELGVVSQHMVKLEPGADRDAIARQIDERFARDEAPTQTRSIGDFVQRTLSEIAEVIGFAQLLGYVAVLIMAVILANTVFMSAQARRAEFGVLQVIGVTRPGLFAAILGEALLLALGGGVLGIGAVTVGLNLAHLGIGIEGYQVDFTAGPQLMLEGMGMSLAVGLLAGLAPAIQASTSKVADALRPE